METRATIVPTGPTIECLMQEKTCIKLPSDLFADDRLLCDVEMILNGAFAPLNGFLCRNDYRNVLNEMRLTTGHVWTVPIVFPVPKKLVTTADGTPYIEAETGSEPPRIETCTKIKIRDKIGVIVAELVVEDIFSPDIDLEISKMCGKVDMNHPYAQCVTKFKDCYYIGGRLNAKTPVQHFDFCEHRGTPQEVKQYIKSKNWDKVIGFQTRNPIHKSHFELTKKALSSIKEKEGKNCALLLTPAVGPTQPGDISYYIRVRCYQRLLKYYEGSDVGLFLLPLAMRMAGPREAVWHAIIRKNYGCTHFIVGRDHAGPSAMDSTNKPFYGPYEAQELVKQFADEIGIEPIFSKSMVYSPSVGYVEDDVVPPGAEVHSISGTRLRDMLSRHEVIPSWFSYPEVIDELHKFFIPPSKQGFCVYFTGLPCSGKSTLSNALEAKILENRNELRKVTLLDADVVRQHLSHGLGFSREHRGMNVRRIGYVASEIVKHGGICLVANIAPYEEDRLFNRQLISSTGGYVEVYVSTSLEVCESRDIKELYKKARNGTIQHFTGISDPYEVPKCPELAIDSTCKLSVAVSDIWKYLEKHGWVV